MKKLIKLDFDNTTRERKTEDSYSELYSYDKNNGSFEFEILNDTLTTEQVIALFKFTESNKIWKTTGIVEGNKVKVTFDTSLITQNETVICYLYFDEEQRTSDTFRFKFKVKVSEIDKMNRYEVKERFINNTVIVDRLDVVTKTELQEALKNVGGIATEGLLTEVKADEIYAKKSEAVDNTNFELVKNRVLALELKTDKDTVYDDSEVKERLTTLENKAPVDLSGYATKEELNNISGSQPLADNLVTKEELENKHYISDVSNLATKEELQEVRNNQPTVDTSHLVTREELESKGYVTELHLNNSTLAQRVSLIEEQPDKDTVYDDTPLKERITALESKAIEGGAYDDSDLRNRVVALESKEDKDTKYDDAEVKRRLTELENKPAVDTSVFVTDEKLASKGYLTQHQSLENVVTKEELEAKHFVTEEALNNKAYLTSHQDLSNYALKSEIPTPYNDSPLTERVTALESKAIGGGAYDDTDLRNRVRVLESKQDKDTVYNDEPIKERLTALENKPNVDLTNYVTNEQLENKHYLTQHQPLDNLVTKEELNSKGYLTDEVLNSKGYLTDEVLNSKNYLTEDVLNTKNYLTQHQDLSSLVTKQELENKHFLTEHQTLTHLATTSDLEALRNIAVSKSELNNKVDNNEFNSFKDNVVTKTELAEKGYISDLSNYVTKQELHEAIEIDYSNIVTTDELEPYAKKSELPTPYNDSALVSRVSALESKHDNDTIYNDTEVKQRLTALESRPTTGGSIDTSNFVTKDELNTLKPNQTLSLNNSTLSISGGNSVTLPTNKFEIHGTGMPNGVVEAEIGTTYVDKNKTNGALKWIKTTDGGNTGWEVLIGDTGWRTLNSVSRVGNSFIKIRRVNNLITYQFGGLQWGWFGVGRRNGPGFAKHNSSGDKGAKVVNPGGIPVGFRSETSLVGGTYDDKGRPYGIWYLGGVNDSNFIQFTFNDPIPTDRDIADIRVSAISYLTNEPWPVQLP